MSAAQGKRPKIGLVLSGGGARGLAQIGVLKALEKHHIPIDVVVGNSFGSVIGGLYASGYTTANLETLAMTTNWSELLSFSEETKRTDLFVGQKQTQPEGYLVLRFDGLQPIIPSSISGGQRLSSFFTYLDLQALYHPEHTFDDLKIPFRATATDLLSGRRIVIDRGSLAEALRSSITVPLLYSSVDRDSMSLVDGGLTSNIPVDVARSMGCDIVLVVNSTSPMRTADQLNAPWEIADQIMTIMMQDQNRRQLADADLVFSPDAGNRIASDFSGIDSLIAVGEREAEAQIPKLLMTLQRQDVVDSSWRSIALTQPEITFAGAPIDGAIRQKLRDWSRGSRPMLEDVQRHVDELWATDRYTDVYAEVEVNASPSIVRYIVAAAQRIEGVVILGDGKSLPSKELIERELNPLIGTSYRQDRVQVAIERLLADFRTRGFSLARIESVFVDSLTHDLTMTIHAGHIGEIKFEGNERTRDYVLRREVPLAVGDVFNVDMANRGLVNLKSIGLFEYALIEVRYVNDQPVVVFKVKEKSAELLRLGLHADSEHEFVTTVDIHDANFRGAWEDVGLMLRYGPRDRVAQFNYTINRIFHSYLTLNTKAYFKSRDVFTYANDPSLGPLTWDRLEDGRYKLNRFGWSLAFGSHVERFGDITAELRVENHNLIAVSGGGYVPERYRFVGLKFQSIIDTEDDFFFPTDGMYLSLSYESAMKGLGSDVGFGKVEFTYETYLLLSKRHMFRPRVVFGFADATLPTAEQFSLGGMTSFYGLREDDSRGRQLFIANMEYRYALPFKIIFDSYVSARYDLGTISALPEELKIENFRHGFGAALALDTPLGPATFGLGKSFYLRRDLTGSPVTVGPLVFYFSFGHTL